MRIKSAKPLKHEVFGIAPFVETSCIRPVNGCRGDIELAKKLINETTRKRNIKLDQRMIYSDCGPSMTSRNVANL